MDVLVVGCGASGVAALRRLHELGLRALGLEASARLGGRIHTARFGDNVVDLGAQWCHGEKNNAVHELVKDLAVLDRPTSQEQRYLLSTGEVLDTDLAQRFVDKFNSTLDSADKNNQLSISEYLRTQIKDVEFSDNEHLKNPILEWFERFNHVGGQTDPKRSKSLRGLQEAWPCEGEFMLNWKDRGYTTLLNILLKSFPNQTDRIPVEILYNKEVETIKWRSTAAGKDSSTPLVQVVCKDGSMYAATYVIVTVSVGVLQKRHQQMFNPPLPQNKITTIENLELCILDKIYVHFEKAWWPANANYFSLVWRPEDRQQFEEDTWVREIYGASTVEYQPKVLCFWIYGEGAKEMEKMDEERVRAGIASVLKVFFRSFQVSKIIDMKRSQWHLDPLTGGAYAYRCVRTEETDSSAAVLSEPLYAVCGGRTVPTVCFAGEATSSRRHGAVHGAVEAGFREANRVWDSMAASRS